MKILDACCGSKLFWFDKNNDFATYMDIREESYEIYGKKVMEYQSEVPNDTEV